MKLDQISMTFNQLQQNVNKSIKKVKKTHCKKFIEYAYGKKNKAESMLATSSQSSGQGDAEPTMAS